LFLRRPSGRRLAGHFRVQIKIAAALLAWQPSLWKKRVKIQSNKVIAPREIETWLFRE
jgi:hypothetical protein